MVYSSKVVARGVLAIAKTTGAPGNLSQISKGSDWIEVPKSTEIDKPNRLAVSVIVDSMQAPSGQEILHVDLEESTDLTTWTGVAGGSAIVGIAAVGQYSAEVAYAQLNPAVNRYVRAQFNIDDNTAGNAQPYPTPGSVSFSGQCSLASYHKKL